MIIYLILVNDEYSYSIFNKCYKTKEEAEIAILVQQETFPNCGYQILTTELDEEVKH